VRPVPLRPVV